MTAPSKTATSTTPSCCPAIAAACAGGTSRAGGLICSACVHRTNSHSATIATPVVATACNAASKRIRPGSDPKNRSTHFSAPRHAGDRRAVEVRLIRAAVVTLIRPHS